MKITNLEAISDSDFKNGFLKSLANREAIGEGRSNNGEKINHVAPINIKAINNLRHKLMTVVIRVLSRKGR